MPQVGTTSSVAPRIRHNSIHKLRGSLLLAAGSMKETTSMGKTTSHPARKIKPNQARPREISISTCSTLRVPGSIYVGTGLGIKKETTWVSSGGTAKEMLTKILADQHQAQDGKAVATTVHDVSPEEYD